MTKHTCSLTGTTYDGRPLPPCVACQEHYAAEAREALAHSDATRPAYTRADVARAWTQGHNAGSAGRFLSENPYDNHLNPLPPQGSPLIDPMTGKPW